MESSHVSSATSQLQLISMGNRLEDLDEDVLDWIFNHCSLRDCIRTEAVCKSWLSFSERIRRRNQLPWLMMASDPNCMSVEGTRSFFSLSDDTTYEAINFPEMHGKRCCGSFSNANARGWLMTTDDRNLEMGLFHLWRKTQLQLPDHSTLPCRYPCVGNEDHPHIKVIKIRTAAISDDAKVVVVIHDSMALAFCRIGDTVWTPVSPKIVYRDVIYQFNDVIYHKGQFYAVTLDGSVGVLHINTARPYVEILSILTEKISLNDYYTRTYLVADSASERLFIFVRLSILREEVERDPYNYDSRRTLGFKVYEIRPYKNVVYEKNPVEVESLNDRLIFLGQNSSMHVMASQFPGFKGNCIYFTDDFMEASCFKSPLGCIDLGIFDMEDKTIQPLLLNRFHPTFSPPIWIAPPV